MVIKTNLSNHPQGFVLDEYQIGAVEMLPIAAFNKIQAEPMADHPVIARNGDQGVDLQSGNIITLLLINDTNMDGMLFDVGCHGRCVSAAHLPGIRAAIAYQLMSMVKRLVYDTIETCDLFPYKSKELAPKVKRDAIRNQSGRRTDNPRGEMTG